MPSLSPSTTTTTFLVFAAVLLLARPAYAFGAGNIATAAKIEGSNWRHGDIEDTLLTLLMSRAAGGKKFDKMSIKRVYFGNWGRDYSQAIDVGTVKSVSAEAIRIVLWVLSFMTFGYGTKEFELTADRLGCYRPEDHIDNPKDYADNLDAREYDQRLRGPINEEVELAIDSETGMKNYIANERAGIMTSAQHVRKLLGEVINLGRRFSRDKNKDDLYEALRLLGTALHCLEDYSAHSNYTELSLIEMGERDIFPHVGRDTQIRLPGVQQEVFPLVTGTFGGVDFLHSVMGEISDKATQSEIQSLEGTLQTGSQGDTSLLKQLLSSLPDGLFGGTDEASKADEIKANATAAQLQQTHVSPREPEAFTQQAQEAIKQIYPIIEWHDEVMLSITETIENIPVLPEVLERIEGELTVFVFSLIGPFVLPIIGQIKSELETGSSEVIKSSRDKQLIVFNEDRCSDPTHSMLSKDHFSNILNEPAGKIASQVLTWAVPQIIACWDDENADANRTITRIINGVFHHPAMRNQGDDGASEGRQAMFGVVEQWWRGLSQREQDDLRRKLSREGVQNGENHKEGVHDTGHGCGKPLGMAKLGGKRDDMGIGKMASDAAGGGALGGIVGTLAGGISGSILAGAFGGDSESSQTQGYASAGNTSQGGYKQQYTEVGSSGNQYAQAQYSETSYPGGGRQTDYKRYEQSDNQSSSYEQRTESKQTYGGGYGNDDNERRQEYDVPGGFGGGGGGRGYGERDEGRREQESSGYGRRSEYEEPQRQQGYGGGGNEYGRSEEREERSSGYGGGGNQYGRGEEREERSSGYGRGEDREERSSGYGGGGNQYGRDEERSSGYGRDEERSSGYGGGGGYGGGNGGGRGDRDDDERRGNRRDDDDEERGDEYGGGRRRDDGEERRW